MKDPARLKKLLAELGSAQFELDQALRLMARLREPHEMHAAREHADQKAEVLDQVSDRVLQELRSLGESARNASRLH